MAAHCYGILLRKAARQLTAVYDEALAPVGVNLAQFSLLRTIARAGALSFTELGRRTDLDRSTIGRNMRVLERRGLVALADASDRREAMMALTDAGRAVLARGAAPWDEAQRRIESALGTEEAARLETMLKALGRARATIPPQQDAPTKIA